MWSGERLEKRTNWSIFSKYSVVCVEFYPIYKQTLISFLKYPAFQVNHTGNCIIIIRVIRKLERIPNGVWRMLLT